MGRLIGAKDSSAPSTPTSSKNQEGQRDSEKHQPKQGNQWYFGMKAPIGADGDSELAHPVVVTAANVADITQRATA